MITFRDFETADAAAMLAGGHAVLVGSAGMGKTLLIRSKILPRLRESGAHFIVCDYHGEYVKDGPTHFWINGEFNQDNGRADEFGSCMQAAIASSVILSQQGHDDGVWDRFLASFLAEVYSGRGPSMPWFLIVDVSHRVWRMQALLDFIPMAKKYGCTLVITTQRLVEFEYSLFVHFSSLAQFRPGYRDGIIDATGRAPRVTLEQIPSMLRTLNALNRRQFICFSETILPQGYSLDPAPGYGLPHNSESSAPSC